MNIKRLLLAIGILATLTACEEGDIVIEDLGVEEVEVGTEVTEVAVEEVEEVEPILEEEVVEENPLPATTPVEEPTYNLTETDLEYLEVINYALDVNRENLEETLKIINELKNNPDAVSDPRYTNMLEISVMKSQGVVDVLTNMVSDYLVPPIFTASHDKLINIFKIQTESFTYSLEGFRQSNEKLIALGDAKLEESIPLLGEFNDDMSTVIN